MLPIAFWSTASVKFADTENTGLNSEAPRGRMAL